MIKKEKITKDNIVKFPSRLTDLEKQIEEITKEIGYLLDKHGKNYKISSLEQFNRNKNPSILLGSLYLIGEYKKRNI